MEEICAKHENIVTEGHGGSHGSSAGANGTSSANATDSSGGGHKRRKRASHGSSSSASSSSSSSGASSSSLDGDLELTGELLHHYLADLGTPCEDMMLRCHFEGRSDVMQKKSIIFCVVSIFFSISRFFNCSEIFIPTITDEGQCCSFNIMPESVMFQNAVVMVGRLPNYFFSIGPLFSLECIFRFKPTRRRRLAGPTGICRMVMTSCPTLRSSTTLRTCR